jgi:hypothetical protein
VRPGERLHRLDRRAVGNAFDHLVPTRLLFRAEVRSVEQLLQAQQLDAAPARLRDERQVLLEHPLLDVFRGPVERNVGLHLYQSAAYHSAGHGNP